jgi:RNA polymerase sigma-70 factor, ECF subfamily
MDQSPNLQEDKKQSAEDIEKLVTLVQKGDMQAFAQLYDQFVDRIYKYFYFKTAKEEAFDLTENVFLKVWENIRKYKPREGASFSSWLYRIAHNLLVDHYRQRKVTAELDVSQADHKVDNNPLYLTEQSLSKGALKQALSKLRENYREVITLAFVNGLENAEIAEILKKSEGTLRVLKFRALRELKKILEEMGVKY